MALEMAEMPPVVSHDAPRAGGGDDTDENAEMSPASAVDGGAVADKPKEVKVKGKGGRKPKATVEGATPKSAVKRSRTSAKVPAYTSEDLVKFTLQQLVAQMEGVDEEDICLDFVAGVQNIVINRIIKIRAKRTREAKEDKDKVAVPASSSSSAGVEKSPNKD